MSHLTLISNHEQLERSLSSLHSKGKTAWDRYHIAGNGLLRYVEASNNYSGYTIMTIQAWADAKKQGKSLGNRQAISDFQKNPLRNPSLQDAALMEWRLSCLENLINRQVEQF